MFVESVEEFFSHIFVILIQIITSKQVHNQLTEHCEHWVTHRRRLQSNNNTAEFTTQFLIYKTFRDKRRLIYKSFPERIDALHRIDLWCAEEITPILYKNPYFFLVKCGFNDINISSIYVSNKYKTRLLSRNQELSAYTQRADND